ncbi:DUF4192 family protein [Kitasatospora sp. KL5]|uniref:DUF4192 domain-containing protein n=1 Tax=Kitasatospora sp. KL5 TaxID=3425125 RepID=UPI003D6FB6AD
MNHDEHRTPSAGPLAGPPTTLLPMQMRGPADMAEMLPYLLGFFPDDSIVAVGLQGPSLQQGGVVRVDIPEDPAHWQPVARDIAALLMDLSEKRDRRPDQVLLYLVRDPVDAAEAPGGAPPGGHRPVESLRPLADRLAAAFRGAGVAVKESLCVSGGRWWSFLCTRPGCCDPSGTPIRPAHLPSPIATAATFAGLAPRGSRRSIVAGLAPVGPPVADVQRQEIERAGPGFLQELAVGRAHTVDRTGALLAEVVAEFRDGAREIDPERTARLLLGLQDKLGRDRGAEFAEPDELATAQRVWRFLVQRCVSPFEHLAPPPLTLLAWTAWLAGDTATARIMLSRALEVDARYTLAQLLYESINGGLAPERLLESVREQRAGRRPAAPCTGQSPDGTPQGPVFRPRPTGGPAEGRTEGRTAGQDTDRTPDRIAPADHSFGHHEGHSPEPETGPEPAAGPSHGPDPAPGGGAASVARPSGCGRPHGPVRPPARPPVQASRGRPAPQARPGIGGAVGRALGQRRAQRPTAR